MLIIMAGTVMICECASTAGSATPIMHKNPVQKRPRSITPELDDSPKSSGLAHRDATQLGRGARIKVKTTRRGRYWWKRAQERMTRRNPRARTKESEMIVLRPAAMLKRLERCTLVGWLVASLVANYSSGQTTAN